MRRAFIAGVYDEIKKSRALIVEKANRYKERYKSFAYYAAYKDYEKNYYGRKKEIIKHRSEMIFEVCGCTEHQLKQWAVAIEYMIKDTCFIASKAYIYRSGIVRWFIVPDWKRFLKQDEKGL